MGIRTAFDICISVRNNQNTRACPFRCCTRSAMRGPIYGQPEPHHTGVRFTVVIRILLVGGASASPRGEASPTPICAQWGIFPYESLLKQNHQPARVSAVAVGETATGVQSSADNDLRLQRLFSLHVRCPIGTRHCERIIFQNSRPPCPSGRTTRYVTWRRKYPHCQHQNRIVASGARNGRGPSQMPEVFVLLPRNELARPLISFLARSIRASRTITRNVRRRQPIHKIQKVPWLACSGGGMENSATVASTIVNNPLRARP